jgi:hypothetical protein
MPVHVHRTIPLFEERLSTEILERRLGEMGSREFARAFKQRAVSDSDLIFKAAYLDRCKALGAAHTVVERVEPGDYWDKFPRVAGVDLSISKKNEEAAFFVIFVMALTPDKIRWPLYMFRERNLSFGSQKTAIKDVQERFRCQLFMVESVAYQDAMVDEVAETTDIPVKGLCTGSEISPNDLDIGLPSMATEFEHSKWVIPQGDARSIRMMEPWLDELGAYPSTQFTDTVMASFFAREAVRQDPQKRMSVKVIRL